MVMSEKAIVEAMMVAARIQRSRAREMGGGEGVLFMRGGTIKPRAVGRDRKTVSFDCAFQEWADLSIDDLYSMGYSTECSKFARPSGSPVGISA
jgi:hypothetical protein